MNENKIVYRKKWKLFKHVISQEFVIKENSKRVYLKGKLFPIKKNKIYESPDYLLRQKKNTPLIICVLALIIIPLSALAPIAFTRWSIYDLTKAEYSNIANTIYGLTGPFIATAAALLTYAAFIVQKRANDIQIESNNEQIEKNKIESFETLLFKLIEDHRQNVSDLYFEGKSINGENIIYQGQKAISVLTFTVSAIAMLIKKIPDIDKTFNKKEMQIFAYLVFVHGNSLNSNEWFRNSEDFKKYSQQKKYIDYLVDAIDKIIYENIDQREGNVFYIKQALIQRQSNLLISIRRNLMNTVSRYFRQIYQIYVYIDDQTFLTQKQKYKYAKIFRTNLTNEEQELMFNNILSPYGNEWRKKDLILKYKPFKNIASFGKYCYSPYDYLKEFYNLSDKELKDNLDVLTFDNAII